MEAFFCALEYVIDWFFSVGMFMLFLFSLLGLMAWGATYALDHEYVPTAKVTVEDARLCAPAARNYKACLRSLGYKFEWKEKE
jgi:hypothetical protein